MDVLRNANNKVPRAADHSSVSLIEDVPSLNSLTTGLSMRSKTLPPPPEWTIAQALGIETVSTSWLAGDGSDRCYYRIQAAELSFVLMQLSGDDALQLQKDGYEWVKIGRLLHD